MTGSGSAAPGGAMGIIRIGTRASPLAMAQARMVAAALRDAHGLAEEMVELVPCVASGDKVTDRALREIGGKALWTRELDRALIEGEIDCAVHSMKDVETIRPEAIRLAACLARADVRDRLIGADGIDALPAGARLGTSSPRRMAQMRHRRPDVETVLFRGNVQTRLAKLDAGEAEATLLAGAGLDRLGMGDIGAPLAIEEWLPAPQQGVIGIECRAGVDDMIAILAGIQHGPTRRALDAERRLLLHLGGDCHSPVAALAVAEGEEVVLRAELYSEDGTERVAAETRFAAGDPDPIAALAVELLRDAPPSIARLFTGGAGQA